MWDILINIFDVVPRHCINKLTTCVQALYILVQHEKVGICYSSHLHFFFVNISETFFPAKLFWLYISSTGNIPHGLLLTSKLIRHYIMEQYLPWTGPICLPLSQGGVWSMKLCLPGLGIPPNKIDLLWLLLAETLPGVKFYLELIRRLIIIHSQTVDQFCVIFGSVYSYPKLIDQVNESSTICRSLQYNLIASSSIAIRFSLYSWYWYCIYKLVHIDFFEWSFCTAKECVVHSQFRFNWWSKHVLVD